MNSITKPALESLATTHALHMYGNSSKGKLAWGDRSTGQKILTVLTLGIYSPSLPASSIALVKEFQALLHPGAAPDTWIAEFSDNSSITVCFHASGLEITSNDNTCQVRSELVGYGTPLFSLLSGHLPVILPDQEGVPEGGTTCIVHHLQPETTGGTIDGIINSARNIATSPLSHAPDIMTSHGIVIDAYRSFSEKAMSSKYITHNINGKSISPESLCELVRDIELIELMNKAVTAEECDRLALSTGLWLLNNQYLPDISIDDNMALQRVGYALLTSAHQNLCFPAILFMENSLNTTDKEIYRSRESPFRNYTLSINTEKGISLLKEIQDSDDIALKYFSDRVLREKSNLFFNAAQNAGNSTKSITINADRNSASVSFSFIYIDLSKTPIAETFEGVSNRVNYTLEGNTTFDNIASAVDKDIRFGVARFIGK